MENLNYAPCQRPTLGAGFHEVEGEAPKKPFRLHVAIKLPSGTQVTLLATDYLVLNHKTYPGAAAFITKWGEWTFNKTYVVIMVQRPDMEAPTPFVTDCETFGNVFGREWTEYITYHSCALANTWNALNSKLEMHGQRSHSQHVTFCDRRDVEFPVFCKEIILELIASSFGFNYSNMDLPEHVRMLPEDVNWQLKYRAPAMESLYVIPGQVAASKENLGYRTGKCIQLSTPDFLDLLADPRFQDLLEQVLTRYPITDAYLEAKTFRSQSRNPAQNLQLPLRLRHLGETSGQWKRGGRGRGRGGGRGGNRAKTQPPPFHETPLPQPGNKTASRGCPVCALSRRQSRDGEWDECAECKTKAGQRSLALQIAQQTGGRQDEQEEKTIVETPPSDCEEEMSLEENV